MTISRRQRTLLIFLGCVLLITVVSRILSAPAHGKLVPVEQSQAKALVKPKPKVAPASSDEQQYFSLSLPAGYVAQSGQQPGGNLLFSQTILKAGSFGSTVIAIGIQNVPDGGLDADPSYHLRTTQPERFTLTKATFDGEPVTIANDLQSASVVAFWAHGTHFATISTTQGIGNPATNSNADIIKVLETLLSGWSWK
jgi:hypothetical protein